MRYLFAALAPVLSLAGNPELVLPTAAQLRYHDAEIVALIHFNMATFFKNGDPGCDEGNWLPLNGSGSGNPASFNPSALNPEQWFEAINGLGAKIAVLTAKHGCGFTLWPTSAKLPDGSPFPYHSSTDVLQQFVDAAGRNGIGHGFYFSIMKSFYLCQSFSGTNSCMHRQLPGQFNLTESQYEAISLGQVEELWTRYGQLAEVWFDSTNFKDPAKQARLLDMERELQPNAIGTSISPVSWIGTESGHPASGEIWALGCSGLGDPASPKWCPKMCDTTLQEGDKWFWEPQAPIRSLQDMISVYHDTVGRGCTMELDLAPNRSGLIDEAAVEVYKGLGDFVRSCYGTPVASTSGEGSSFALPAAAEAVDRVVLQEGLELGQRVRAWAVQAAQGSSWATLAQGQAIGHKRIVMLPSATKAALRLTISQAVANPQIRHFGSYRPCADRKGASEEEVLVV